MGQIRKFEDLTVWQESRDLVNQIYILTKQRTFLKDHQLANHLRKTAISIPSNISEGFELDGNREFVNFLSIAKGSCGELRCQLYIALDQNYITQEKFDELVLKTLGISRSIGGFMKYLSKSEYPGNKFKKQPPE